MKGRSDRLTAKELKFSQLYVSGQSGYKSAVGAGYSPKSAEMLAYRILKRPIVKEFIDKKLDQMEKELEITIKWKLDRLKKLVELSLPEDAETHKDISVSGVISGISELNKMQGHYSAEKTVNVNANMNADTDVKTVVENIEKYQKDY